MNNDVASERAVLASLLKHGEAAYAEVTGIISISSFWNEDNGIIYRCLENIFNQGKVPDIATIISSASELGLSSYISSDQNLRYLRSLLNLPVELINTRKEALKLRKLEITRDLRFKIQNIYNDLESVNGSESLTSIISQAETPIFDFANGIEHDKQPIKMGNNIDEYLEFLQENRNRKVGISSGYFKYDSAIGGGFRRKTISLIGARSKALRYGSKVYTKNGYVKIEDVKIGDTVLHPFFGETKVIAVHDHANKQLYTIMFRDGDTVECCEDHLWEVYKRYPYNCISNKTAQIKTTKELINDLKIGNSDEYKWDIRLPNPIDFSEQKVPLDPYVLGLLIGDGSFGNSIRLAVGTKDKEIINNVKSIIGSKFDIKIDNSRDTVISYRINGLQPIIRKLGLFKHRAKSKFIPKNYIYNSIQTRIEILRGLLDSDGTIFIDKRSKNSRIRFGSVSLQLTKDVKEIVQSLGGLCSIIEHNQIYKNKPYLSYVAEIRLPNFNPFKLKRKAEKYSARIIGELKRTIVKITPSVIDNARCLTLEHNDGLFMTDNYVVTHNTGKSVLADNIGVYTSGKLRVPTLLLDTEMTLEDHQNRMLAYFSKVPIDIIESARFNVDQLAKVKYAAQQIKSLNYQHESVAGAEFEEIVSIARRWIIKEVGFEGGRTNDALIIYDYLKLMTHQAISGNLAEHQVLGFQISELHNFAVKYDIPILSFVQLNRDGISKESTDAISQSDRLLWLCTNFSIFKAKSEEEVTVDGEEHGNRKLIPLVSRHGPGIDDGNYINMHMQGEYAMIGEGQYASHVRNINNEEFDNDVDDDQL